MANTGKKGEWHDWVGELFEPVFGATIDDLVAHEEEPDNKPKVCQTKYEPPQQCGFRPGRTQIDLYSHRKELEA